MNLFGLSFILQKGNFGRVLPDFLGSFLGVQTSIPDPKIPWIQH